MDSNENNIEFLSNQETATVYFSQGRYINRIKRLAEKYPDECKITVQNKDGSIVAHIPTKWVKLNPPKPVSEKQREIARENFKSMWNSD